MNPPTEKQLSYIKYIAACLEMEEPKVATRKEAWEWLQKYEKIYKDQEQYDEEYWDYLGCQINY